MAEYNRILDHNRGLGDTSDKLPVSGRLLRKEFTKMKPDWVSEVSSWAYTGAFDDLQSAFRMYFQKHKKGLLKPPKGWKPRKDGRPYGWPIFKSRHRATPSFYQHNQSLKFNGHNVRLAVIGWVNMAEILRFGGDVICGRVSFSQGHWWMSAQVEYEISLEHVPCEAVGVDLGIKYLAVTSDGKFYENPKAFIKAQTDLRKFQRKLDRQRRANNPNNYNKDGTIQKGPKKWIISGKMKRTEEKITRLHAKIANTRMDASHKLTTEIANNYGIVCLEDLNIKGMMKNGKLAKVIGDASLHEKRRQLEYKVIGKNGTIVFIDQWFPSSKKCNGCDWVNAELKLSDRSWVCLICGSVNERDKNAALNIRDEGLRLLNE